MRRLVLIGALLLTACGSPRAATQAAAASSVDRIVIEKAAHRMTLYAGARAVRTYKVSLGRGGLAPKARSGDRRTPEGDYRITGRNPGSAYHRSLRIGYPTPAQSQTARARGIDPGGDIMIHGLPNGWSHLTTVFRGQDWTDGCIAVTDPEIEEVWRLVRDGAVVRIGVWTVSSDAALEVRPPRLNIVASTGAFVLFMLGVLIFGDTEL